MCSYADSTFAKLVNNVSMNALGISSLTQATIFARFALRGLILRLFLFMICQEKGEGPACNYAGIKVPTTTTTTTTTTAATTTTTATAATTQSITATRSLPIECYSEECDPPGYSPYKIFPCNK